VAAGDAVDESDVLDLVGELVDKSMVDVERTDGVTRYRLLETLRQFGEERLDEEATQRGREAHLRHYTEVVARLHRRWTSPDQPAADQAFGREWENIRAAHHWAIASGDVARAVALLRGLSGHAWAQVRREFADWARRTMDLAEGAGRCPAGVYNDVGYWSYLDGDLDRAIELERRGLADTQDPGGAARCRGNLAFALMSAGREDEMLALIDELRADTERTDIDAESRWLAAFAWAQIDLTGPGSADALTGMAEATEELGGPIQRAELVRVRGLRLVMDPVAPDIEAALVHLEEAITLSHSAGARASWPVTNRAQVMALVEHPDRLDATAEALDVAYDARNWPATEILFELASRLLAEAGARDVAALVVGHLQLTPPVFGEIGAAYRAATIALLPDDDETAARRRAGNTADRHHLVAEALEGLAEARAAATPTG